MINEVMNVVRDETNGRDSEARARMYLRIAKNLVEIGEDETTAIQRAAMEKAMDSDGITTGFDIQMEEMSALYAQKGDIVGVLTVLTMAKQLSGSATYYEARGALIDAYCNAGEFEAALGFALSEEGIVSRTPTILARRAIYDAGQGKDVTKDVADAMAMVITDSLYKYKEVYPLLGTALAKSGAVDRALEVFGLVEDVIHTDRIDFIDEPNICFSLAGAVHDAGMDSDEIFKNAWTYFEEWSGHEDVAGLANILPDTTSIFENGLDITIKRNKFDIAREQILKEENIGWWKVLHMADLAKQEVMVARDSIAA
jgi:hypothetical protein